MSATVRITFEIDEHDENIACVENFLGAMGNSGHVTRDDCYFYSRSENYIYKKLISTSKQIRFANNPLDYLCVITNKKGKKVILYLSAYDKEFNITKHISYISFCDEHGKSEMILFKKDN